MREIFKMVPGFVPYEVSTFGRLRRRGCCVLTTPKDKAGYPRKYLKDLGRNLLIHRAVALCFIPNPNNLREVNHKDGDKSNNEVSNLEWVSRRGNTLHAYRLGLMQDQRGDRGHTAKLTEIEVRVVREALSNGFTQTGIAKYFKLDQSTINLIHRRVNWNHI